MRCIVHGQRGAALVTAIFLLVAFAALGAYMLTVGGVSQATTDRALLGARAYAGAKGGLEWGLHRAVYNDAAACAEAPSVTTTSYSHPSADSGLSDVAVTVTCTYSTRTIGGYTVRVSYLTSTATYGVLGNPDYAERKLEATVCRSSSPGSEC